MKNEIENMLTDYGLLGEKSILPMLSDFQEEQEIRDYCWEVLNSYPSLKKETWFIGLEGGDYIYSFEGNYIFITDDIWSFDLVAKQAVLELLAEKIKILKMSRA
ncbi:hypothetical protein [Flavobacterium sp. JAS]|uniref:hypothetical protein n=1 Tax=Flavobacterium sp. JAS TaxID=2897329 RepID=UPI001E3B60FA|nr:hypothetical protein [Flavobacterium sp. JAS]MCD0472295.1 hypothetical protein [Flavobacterium sp. JAS]